MQHAQRGFTLLELMIVIAVIAIIAAIAIPNLLSARLNAHEAASIATLRNISTSQSQFQASNSVDLDFDGTGEFGFFRELSGSYGLRRSADGSVIGNPLRPPSLSGSFRVIQPIGMVNRSGYLFRLYLPGAGGTGIAENQVGSFTGDLNNDLCETTWCAYAWPVTHDNSGSRTFFVNQTGNLSWTNDATYSGPAFMTVTQPGIAFQAGAAADLITGLVAIGTLGRDGNTWRQVN